MSSDLVAFIFLLLSTSLFYFNYRSGKTLEEVMSKLSIEFEIKLAPILTWLAVQLMVNALLFLGCLANFLSKVLPT
jgi:hypothetical protein